MEKGTDRYGYEGDLKEGHPHGQGHRTWANGEEYKGQWKHGRRNGKGVQLYPKGSRYEGDWKDDERHGEGQYFYTNGDRYRGFWQHNQKHGHGEYMFADGSIIQGMWDKGQRNGLGNVYGSKRQLVAQGHFQNDVFTLLWQLVFDPVSRAWHYSSPHGGAVSTYRSRISRLPYSSFWFPE